MSKLPMVLVSLGITLSVLGERLGLVFIALSPMIFSGLLVILLRERIGYWSVFYILSLVFITLSILSR